tara:strand:+ start:1569 stop:1739 length:171 start_codon:yes stop_codon:yes gene_type:complete
MKVGDLVKYYGSWTDTGVVLYINEKGGTVKVYCSNEGNIKWWVTSGCEVLNGQKKI